MNNVSYHGNKEEACMIIHLIKTYFNSDTRSIERDEDHKSPRMRVDMVGTIRGYKQSPLPIHCEREHGNFIRILKPLKDQMSTISKY